MRDLENKIKNRDIKMKELIKYGFREKKQKNQNNEKITYYYEKEICDNQFKIIVLVKDNKLFSKVIDLFDNEEYVLVDIEDAAGEFVGRIRQEYEIVLDDIIEKCTVKNVFKQKQSKQVIKYIEEKYYDELEFLWEKLNDTAICRNKINNKWYVLLGKVKLTKLGIHSNEEKEIMNLTYQKEKINEIIDNKTIFPGYHMNKKSWITIVLDNRVSTEEIFKLIDNSYNISLGNKNGKKESNLDKKIYDYLTFIPKGKVVTYGQIAKYLGNKGLARYVGTALHKNPDGDKYPCYKVLNSKGELAEEFVFGGKEIQKKRLEKEGIKVVQYKVDLKKYQWNDKKGE